MRRVLIISYYAPPLGMGGVQRVTKFSKYLPYYGWEPIILTVKPITYYAYDESLLQDLKGIPIYRSESLDPARLLYLFSKKRTGSIKPLVRPLLHYPFLLDSKSLWIPFAYQMAKKIHRLYSPDIIFTTSPPLSVHLLGLLLKRRYRTPLILDLRDPFLNTRPPTSLHNWIQKKTFYKLRDSSDGFVVVNERIAKIWDIDALILENGFDPEDFRIEPSKRDDRFSIGYIGSLLGREESLLGLKEALKETGVVLKIVGRVDKSLIKDIRGIEYYGYLPHSKGIGVMKSCDALWLTVEKEWMASMVPGKLFEYMGIGLPILATVDEKSEIARYIREYRCGIVVPPKRERIVEALKALKEGRIKIAPKGVDRFNRRYQTEKLSSFFCSILDRYA